MNIEVGRSLVRIRYQIPSPHGYANLDTSKFSFKAHSWNDDEQGKQTTRRQFVSLHTTQSRYELWQRLVTRYCNTHAMYCCSTIVHLGAKDHNSKSPDLESSDGVYKRCTVTNWLIVGSKTSVASAARACYHN
jgi:hypothetical protein